MYNEALLNSKIGEKLYRALLRVGYISLLESLHIGIYPHAAVESVLKELDDELRSACELFCLNRRVDVSRLSPDVREVVLELAPAGIVRHNAGGVSIAPLTLYVVQGLLYFAEAPGPLITIYFGRDSMALASRLNLLSSSRGRVLDLFSGPGIQGLLAASCGYDVTAVEINPLAASLANCNAALNGLSEHYETVVRSVEDFLSSSQESKFSKIFANPPLVPIPDQYSYQFVGAGGVDGLAFTRPVVEMATKMLSPGGELVTIGLSGGDEFGPYLLDILDKVMEFECVSCVLTILGSSEIAVGSNWLSLISHSLSNFSLSADHLDADVLRLDYLREEVSHVYLFSLGIIADLDERRKETSSALKVVDLSSSEISHCDWWIGGFI